MLSTSECINCDGLGWIPQDDDTVKACPECRPGYVHPEDRRPPVKKSDEELEAEEREQWWS